MLLPCTDKITSGSARQELFQLRRAQGLVEDRKERLLDRANTRFKSHIELNYQKMSKKEGWIGAHLKVAVLPRYPSNPLYEIDNLIEHVMTKTVAWRQVGFPRESYGVLSQHESAIVLGPGSVFSMLEANVWGLHFYATEIERKAETYQGIHLGHLLGHVLVFLEHSRTLLSHSGYSGALTIQVALDGICGVPLVYFEGNEPQKGPHSELDNQVSFSLEISADDLQNHRDRVAMDLLKQIFYVVNWPDMAGSPEGMQMRIKEGYKYNMWNPSSLSL